MMISYRYPQLLFVAILVGWEEEANSVGVFPALQALVPNCAGVYDITSSTARIDRMHHRIWRAGLSTWNQIGYL